MPNLFEASVINKYHDDVEDLGNSRRTLEIPNPFEAPFKSPDDVVNSRKTPKVLNPFEDPIKNNDLDAVKSLVKGGTDPKIPIGDGWPAIFWTGKCGSLAILKYFVEELEIDPHTQDNYGQTTILLSARHGNLDVLRYLVEECDVDPFECDKCERDCVLKAKHGQNTHILEYLETPACRIHLVKRKLAEFDEFGPKKRSQIQSMPKEMLRKSCFWETFGYHWPTLDEIKAIVKVLTNDKVLSVGAGHAFLEHFLEKAGLNIVATDPLYPIFPKNQISGRL